MSILCSMVGASFTVAAAAQILRSKKGITAVGNAQVDTAQSKFGGASLLMDGSGDRLNVTGEVLPAQYTVEYWFRLASFTSAPTFVDFRGGGSDNYSDFITTGGVFTVFIKGSSIVTSALSTNTWYHIAVVRDSSSDIKLYLNGTKTGVTLNDASYGLNTSWYIGDNYLFVSSVDGHMDEIRVSKSARYTANFSVATAPFVNDDNTVLLIHANGTDGSTFFEDDNGATTTRTAKTITTYGTAPQISTAQEKFGQSSLLFDGSGDYLIVPASNDFNFGTGNWTIECWFRRISGGAIDWLVGNRPNSFGDGNFGLYTYSSFIEFDYRMGGGGNNTLTTSIANDTWYHFAVVRNGTSYTLYKDGAVGQTKTIPGSDYFGSSSLELSIGCNTQGSWPLNGYIDELRISKVARYTAAFTAPTTTFENDANTVLLIHAEGADGADALVAVTDDNSGRSPKGIVANGNAQISTAQSKFGGSSALFDGTNDKLVVNGDFSQTGDFTFECWFRTTTVSGDRCIFAIGNEATDRQLVLTSGNDLKTDEYGVGGIDISPDNTVTTDTWHHAALTRSGTTVTLWFNGVSQGTITSSATIGNANNLYIGALSDDAIDYSGYIDEFRVSNIARYTAAFTPSTSPFVNDANTVLLIHADGTNGSTVFRDDNGIIGSTPKAITANGNAQISTAQSKFGGSSALFDGTGDYLSISNAESFNFGTANWTIEGWYRASVTSNDHYIINLKSPTSGIAGLYDTGGGFGHWGINIYQGNWRAGAFNNKLVGGVGSGVNTGIDTTTWHHFALVRDSSTTLKYYIDGTQIGSTVTLASTDNFNSTSAIIGSYINDPTGAFSWNGYLDEIRISNSARYTAAFTPSTTAFTQDSNTLLLIHADGANASTTFIDSSGRFQVGVQAIGNAQVDTAQSKFGGASLLLDGTGDYLNLSASQLNFESDFTVEGWIRPTADADTFFSTAQTGTSTGFWISTWTSAAAIIGYRTSAGGGAGAAISSAGVFTYNAWNHIALSRSGTTAELYVNGTRVLNLGDFYNSNTTTVEIGRGRTISDGSWNASGLFEYTGHIDEVRVSNTRRYSGATSFTPSTTPFQNDDNTILLLHCDGTDASTLFFDDNGAKPYTL